MSNEEKARLVAWDRELASAHGRLRAALEVARESVESGDLVSARSDLVLYCHGFCVALEGHHRSEDAALFPVLAARHPQLAETIGKLEQDHRMLSWLITDLEHALTSDAPRDDLARHLEGIGAIMESHFQYEERQLLAILASLELDAEPAAVLGPL